MEATAVQMDERYGYMGSKAQPFWEATAIEPQSRLVLEFVGGRRDEKMIKELMASTRDRLSDPSDLVLMSDGARSYEALFASIFGSPYRPARRGDRGRLPKLRHRINRDLAHLQVIKRRERGRVVEVIPRVAHGSRKRVNRELERLAYSKPNLSAIERQNGTARRMNAYMVRKSLSFGRTKKGREALGWFSTLVYNFCRTHRGLREPLSVSEGRRRYQQRTPAMAAKLTESIWTVTDVLCTPVYREGGTG